MIFNANNWVELTTRLAEQIHQNSVNHGFWPNGNRNDGEAIALMHSELSEALEAVRSGNPLSEKAKGFTQLEEELADCIIRILDYAEGRKLDIAAAILKKVSYNKHRPEKHGREF